MSIKIFVDDTPGKDGKYMVLQQDSETEKRFGVKDFDTLEEARQFAEDMQRAIDKGVAERNDNQISD